jgi:hypothetical protein
MRAGGIWQRSARYGREQQASWSLVWTVTHEISLETGRIIHRMSWAQILSENNTLMKGFPFMVRVIRESRSCRVNFLIPRSGARISLIVCGLIVRLFARTRAERNGSLLENWDMASSMS